MRATRSRPGAFRVTAVAMALLTFLPAAPVAWAANHREAPITALDHKADITDVYAFVSYDDPGRVTMILNVDAFLEPSNGPNYFPFDDEILYAIKIDNNNDAIADVTFEVRFRTEIRQPDLFTGFAGTGTGVDAPANSPPPVPPGTLIVPPAITALDGPGSLGLSLRQTYTVTMVKGGVRTNLGSGIAVPTNVGPRTMPDYANLVQQGIFGPPNGVRTWTGTADDPFWIDLGGAFDTLNTSKAPPILSASEDVSNQNSASDSVSGFNVNTIAIEVPIPLLTRTGNIEPATSTAATIGVWATTSRPRIKVLPSRPGGRPTLSRNFTQIQRMGNPLINELLIGTGLKNKFSMSEPKNDSQFADFVLDPALARVVNALTGGAVAIPDPPRVDLLPLVTYGPPIAASGTPAGPIADLLRLNTGVPPTPVASQSRLGLLGGDAAGFPNGRRVSDDVTDVALRVVVGGVLAAPFPGFDSNIGGRLGDGVNVNDVPYKTTFPYVAPAHSGRNRRHVDPGEPACTPLFGGGAPCLP